MFSKLIYKWSLLLCKELEYLVFLESSNTGQLPQNTFKQPYAATNYQKNSSGSRVTQVWNKYVSQKEKPVTSTSSFKITVREILVSDENEFSYF